MESKVWGVECKNVQNVKCLVWSVKCRVKSVECDSGGEIWSVNYRVWSGECGV